MELVETTITGGDYSSAGAGSKMIKEVLKKIGVNASVVRRAMVAVYEAEMNVAIHAHGGVLRAAITAETLEVLVEDTGPGIPDIELALSEGYSTAPRQARELGFGAGMGLPNIRRNTDRFSIDSNAESGTRLRFAVLLSPQTTAVSGQPALRISEDRCIRCLRCLVACPTGAIRLRHARPEIRTHLCVNCTSCIGICPQKVFAGHGDPVIPQHTVDTLLVVSAAAFGQFGPGTSRDDVMRALGELGWHRVLFTELWERALVKAVTSHAIKRAACGVMLPPVCPAVLHLIQLRYPSLLPHVPPFLSPIEAVRESMNVAHLVIVPSCPAQAALARGVNALNRVDVLNPESLMNDLLPRVRHTDTHVEDATPEVDGDAVGDGSDVMTVSGMGQVCAFLDDAENGRMNDCGIVLLYACEQGCYGAPVWKSPAAVSRRRARVSFGESYSRAPHRVLPLAARAGLRLDEDMSKAIAKLARINAIVKSLPGRDCGVCGAPGCLALAEDVALGVAATGDCPFLSETGAMTQAPPKRNHVNEVDDADRRTGAGKPHAGDTV